MKIGVDREYGPLGLCIASPPRVSLIGAQPINAVQAHYFEQDPPELDALVAEHRELGRRLVAAGAEVLVPPAVESPFQMFCRDPAFVVGDTLFLARMRRSVRRPEAAALGPWLEGLGLAVEPCGEGSIEGGDVLVDRPVVFVGLSERTTPAAAAWLARRLAPEWEVIPIELAAGVLHLDCVLSITGEDRIIYCPELILGGREAIERRYSQRVRVSPQEVFDMACNTLSLGGLTLVEEGHAALAAALAEGGHRVETVRWRELRKLGGLFRCAVCPLLRG